MSQSDQDPLRHGCASADPSTSWTVEHRRGSAQQLHDAAVHDAAVPGLRCVVVNDVDHPALVLGSTQPVADVDLDALTERGVELARRRSGGGAVLLEPGRHVWVDVVLPSGDPRWVDDVGTSSLWLGQAWADLFAEGAGEHVLEVHDRVDDVAAGRVACFAGTGPGELFADGAKLVGVSQRRTRRSARFQCLVHRSWRPEPTLALLAAERIPLVRPALTSSVIGMDELGVGPEWDVVGELLARIG